MHKNKTCILNLMTGKKNITGVSLLNGMTTTDSKFLRATHTILKRKTLDKKDLN